MSTFGSGGFGGFGQSNNQQSSGFGGFGTGSNTNSNTTAFGTNSGFSTNTSSGGGLFGSGGGGSTTGFGTGGATFGSTSNSTFGSKAAFGSGTGSSGSGLFGSSTPNAGTGGGFGGFGSTSTSGTVAASTSSPFGGGSGGLFGANKPSFGATGSATTGSTSLFGGSSGAGGFGATNNPGLGTNVGDPPGTAGAQFQAHQEREGTSSTQNSFQNILFQDPYKKWSAEELRLADYYQGRRHGNATGGAGAFGVSSGFGSGSGFGAGTQAQGSAFGGGTAATTLFGSTTSGTSGFGQTSTTSGFGSGGGLFGQNKPATSGGLFGSGTSQPAQSSGLFGSTGAGSSTGGFGNTGATGGFGSTGTTGGAGLFGAAGQAQNKPGGFSFGSGGGTGASSGFGTTNTTGGFGSGTTSAPSGGGLFGSVGQTNGTGGGALFGSSTSQQQPTTSTFGSSFGAQGQQVKSGGLFGTGGAGAGLGGGTSTGTLGSQPSTSSTSSGLFGAKPAAGTAGSGLFGPTTATQSGGTGSSLFGGLGGGAQQQQQQQTGQTSLFGTSLGQSQQKPSIFGSSTQQPSGGSIFGGQGTQQAGSIFGSGVGQPQQQQPQQPVLGSSFLGESQGGGATPQSLTASIADVSAYGTPSLFSNQTGIEPANPGPLATPLSSKLKPRRTSILPMYKLNPASARYVTPQKRGFGFSYSTYGTPGSPSSVSSTPGGLARSLLGSTLNRGLSKSVSTSSLRRNFNAEDSILMPGAFSTSGGSRLYGTAGSAKKLVINKDMRSDLFSTPTKEKPQLETSAGQRKLSKRVSFDTSNVDADGATSGSAASLLDDDVESAVDVETPRASNGQTNGSKSEREEAKGKELAIVHEEASPRQKQATLDVLVDQEPGEYWMNPSKEEISNMNRMQRQKVFNFTIGRQNVGQIAFKAPVDLSNIGLDDLCGGVVVLETRSATVYPVAPKKPPVGKGLNVPARISLEQSWPRGRDKRLAFDSKRFAKHVERLRRIENTAFEDYNKDTGVWTFSVEHFTTYGLEYEEETDGEDSVPDFQRREAIVRSQTALDEESAAAMSEDKSDVRKNPHLVPGTFDRCSSPSYEPGQTVRNHDLASQPPFLGDSSAGSGPQQLMLTVEEQQPFEDGEYDMSENEEMTGNSLRRHHAAEHDQISLNGNARPTAEGTDTPGGILRARMRALKNSVAPVKMEVADGDDWMEMLQKTVSPQKRDRALLKNVRDSIMAAGPPDLPGAAGAAAYQPRQLHIAPEGRGFATSIDLMNSLFEKTRVAPPNQEASVMPTGFLQWPYDRRYKVVEPPAAQPNIIRPRWGPDGTLVLSSAPENWSRAGGARGGSFRDTRDLLVMQKRRAGEVGLQGIAMAKFSNELAATALPPQIRMTSFSLVDGVPSASLKMNRLASMFQERNTNDPGTRHEKLVWELASILFDKIDDSKDQIAEQRIRKQRLSRFWRELVAEASTRSVGLAKSSEEKAIACLAGHRVQDACKYLIHSKNYHLATLVALINTTTTAKKTMKEQLKEWYDGNLLSEFTEPIRALYEVLSGNVCVCEGKKRLPVEDRLDSFIISNKFQLNWKQAFGLRLWYAISPRDDISVAASGFAQDVEQDREAPPIPWYTEQYIEPLWNDVDPASRQDLLWGLLRLYSDRQAHIESVIRPENSQLSPLDYRLSWQLSRALTAVGKASYGECATEKADTVTYAFASQLTSEGAWLEATFVLLHVTNPAARAKAIRDHLCRYAGLVGPETSERFATLTRTFKIPTEWVWEAIALYMRSVRGDAAAEVQCLIRAGAFAEAHRRLVEQVAPRAIVERDYTGLGYMLAQFNDREEAVLDWPTGGEVYHDFLELVRHVSKREAPPTSLVRKLMSSLSSLQGQTGSAGGYIAAAIMEMGSIVAKAVGSSPNNDQRSLLPKVFGLPLSEDAHMTHSISLSLAYYKGIMAQSS